MTDHLITEPPADDHPVPPPLPDHLSVVLAGHRAFRRDTARFTEALGQVDADDHVSIARLVAWFDAATEALHHHHRIEDEIFWPALRERSRAFVALEQLMQDEHEALDAAIGEAVAAVRALGDTGRPDWQAARRAAEEAVVRMRAILVEHLADEEAHALPLLGEAFTPEEFRELDRKVTELFDPKELGFGACWYLDAASPEEHAVIWVGLPLPLRALYRLHLRRSYRRLAAVLPPIRSA
jgi:hemerythrin-like domain-containing protein